MLSMVADPSFAQDIAPSSFVEPATSGRTAIRGPLR